MQLLIWNKLLHFRNVYCIWGVKRDRLWYTENKHSLAVRTLFHNVTFYFQLFTTTTWLTFNFCPYINQSIWDCIGWNYIDPWILDCSVCSRGNEWRSSLWCRVRSCQVRLGRGYRAAMIPAKWSPSFWICRWVNDLALLLFMRIEIITIMYKNVQKKYLIF